MDPKAPNSLPGSANTLVQGGHHQVFFTRFSHTWVPLTGYQWPTVCSRTAVPNHRSLTTPLDCSRNTPSTSPWPSRPLRIRTLTRVFSSLIRIRKGYSFRTRFPAGSWNFMNHLPKHSNFSQFLFRIVFVCFDFSRKFIILFLPRMRRLIPIPSRIPMWAWAQPPQHGLRAPPMPLGQGCDSFFKHNDSSCFGSTKLASFYEKIRKPKW